MRLLRLNGDWLALDTALDPTQFGELSRLSGQTPAGARAVRDQQVKLRTDVDLAVRLPTTKVTTMQYMLLIYYS